MTTLFTLSDLVEIEASNLFQYKNASIVFSPKNTKEFKTKLLKLFANTPFKIKEQKFFLDKEQDLNDDFVTFVNNDGNKESLHLEDFINNFSNVSVK
jgi:hypothetical protein